MKYYVIDGNFKLVCTTTDEGEAKLIASEVGGTYCSDEDLIW